MYSIFGKDVRWYHVQLLFYQLIYLYQDRRIYLRKPAGKTTKEIKYTMWNKETTQGIDISFGWRLKTCTTDYFVFVSLKKKSVSPFSSPPLFLGTIIAVSSHMNLFPINYSLTKFIWYTFHCTRDLYKGACPTSDILAGISVKDSRSSVLCFCFRFCIGCMYVPGLCHNEWNFST